RPRCGRHPSPPDGRRPDDLRPTSTRLTGEVATAEPASDETAAPGRRPSSPRSADGIVVAAGRSSRMAGADKVLAQIGERPLLAWTLAGFTAAPEIGRVVVVTSNARRDEIAQAAWLPSAVVDVVVGGERRQESVLAG